LTVAERTGDLAEIQIPNTRFLTASPETREGLSTAEAFNL
jgi:hypothetical protein